MRNNKRCEICLHSVQTDNVWLRYCNYHRFHVFNDRFCDDCQIIDYPTEMDNVRKINIEKHRHDEIIRLKEEADVANAGITTRLIHWGDMK